MTMHRRLLFVIKHMALEGGGAERVLAAVASELAGRGHDVTVASFEQPGSEDFYPMAPEVRRVQLGLLEHEGGQSPRVFASAAWRLRNLLGEQRPEVAIGFMYSAYVPLGLAALGRVPVIASEHTVSSYYGGMGLRRLVLPLGIALGDAATIPSESAKQTFSRHLARRMTVVPNPVGFVPVPRAAPSNRRKRVLTVGRLRPEKKHDLLLSAFARLARRFPDWEVALVGDGEERPKLEARARKLGIEDRVVFVGAVSDVAREYASADLFVLPSTAESFALVVAEALRSELPVIGYEDCPPLKDFVRHGENGLIISAAKRKQSLANAMAQLMADEGLRLRMGARGPAAVSNYALPEIVDRWEELIEAVARGKAL